MSTNPPPNTARPLRDLVNVPLQRRYLMLAAVASLIVVGQVLGFSSRGLGWMDEGFYLNWISHPSDYSSSVSQFGFVYRPVFVLFDQDIGRIRAANILFTLALAWSLSWLVLGRVGDAWATRMRFTDRGVLAAALATTSLAPLHVWIMTPSYNWLTLQSLMVTSIGLILMERARESRLALIGAVICGGLGAAGVFLGKPTSALLMTVIVIAYVGIAQRDGWKILVASAALTTVLLIAVSIAIDGSVPRFVDRLTVGAHEAQLRFPAHSLGSMFRWDPIDWSRAVGRVFWGVAVAAAAIGVMVSWTPSGRYVSRVVMVGVPAVTIAVIGGVFGTSLRFEAFEGMWIGGAVAGFLGAVIVVRGRHVVRERIWRPWILVVALAAVPYAYALGSSNSYWMMQSQASIFWVLAAVVAIGSAVRTSMQAPAQMAVFVIVAQCALVLVLDVGIHHPYNQAGGLRSMSTRLELEPGGTLVVDELQGRVFTATVRDARDRGFVSRTGVIDLSGRSPAMLFALQARPLGSPWTLGGYKGSTAAAIDAFDRVPCSQLATAWILDVPATSRSIDPDVLLRRGLDARDDYRTVSSIRLAGSAVQRLRRPLGSKASMRAKCHR